MSPGAEIADHPAGVVGAVHAVVGEEELLVERAIARLVATAREEAVGAQVHQVQGSVLAPGELAALTSPSLFGGDCVVVILAAQDAPKEVVGELTRLMADQPPDVTLILSHAGGVKGKALLTALTKHGARVVDCPKITRPADRVTFVRGEFRTLGRSVDESGVRALLEAVGNDLRAIAAACSQLAADTTGVVDQSAVARYYRGRAEASGFAVADRAVEGRLGEALELLRWALSVGVAPPLITSALAQSVRLLGRVGGAPRGRADAALAGEVGAPPWKIDLIRRQLRDWTPEGIARAVAAVAYADAQVKGEGVSAGYALEEAIRAVVAARSGR